ncbi:hypothetical protein D3C85_1922420 [compost metagenome]
MERTIKTILPANMIYQQETTVLDGIEIEEHISLQRFDRQTKLGTTWHLGVTPFAVLEPEVIVK